jgi:DeoR/GlpR family transcriptional regulator of sugar metabolism
VEIGEPGFDLLLIGGSFQSRSNSVAGRFAIDNLRQVYADKSFIGIDGLTLEHGCTVPSNAEAEIIRLMIERTRGPVIVLADHSKWGVVSNFAVARIEQIDHLVSDEGLTPEVHAALAARAVKILIAGTPEPQLT